MYSINWQYFIEERLESPLRKPKNYAFFHGLLAPIKTLHTRFLMFKTAQEREVNIMPQVRILRYWLNELYDSTERRFEILDYTNTTPILIWGESYNNPIYLPVFLSSKDYDFTVIAPCEAYPQRFFILSFLHKYKLAGKRFKLKFQTDTGDFCPLVGLPDWSDF